jgi:hypothetical protein
VKLNTRLYLVQSLRTSGAIPLFRLYAFMIWTRTILLFYVRTYDLVIHNCKVGNAVPTLAIRAREAGGLRLHRFLTSVVDKSQRSASNTGRFTPRKTLTERIGNWLCWDHETELIGNWLCWDHETELILVPETLYFNQKEIIKNAE